MINTEANTVLRVEGRELDWNGFQISGVRYPPAAISFNSENVSHCIFGSYSCPHKKHDKK